MDLRDYGLGNYTSYIVGRPHVAKTMKQINGTKADCPNCHCDTFAEIEVLLENMPLLNAKFALGRYLSCLACPWASPMMCVGLPEDNLPEWFARRKTND
jgi:hypothetical protein